MNKWDIFPTCIVSCRLCRTLTEDLLSKDEEGQRNGRMQRECVCLGVLGREGRGVWSHCTQVNGDNSEGRRTSLARVQMQTAAPQSPLQNNWGGQHRCSKRRDLSVLFLYCAEIQFPVWWDAQIVWQGSRSTQIWVLKKLVEKKRGAFYSACYSR